MSAWQLVLALLAVFAASGALADTPASSVTMTTIGPNQSYPEVPKNGEAWFDVGGFCKVVDVGALAWANPPASGVPVFIPGTAAEWENYRTRASSSYHGDLTQTTCCRPQSNIATLCTEAGATPVPVNRQYGKLGETDVVSATCTDQWGRQYTDSIALTCQGDNGSDGQAQWAPSTDTQSNCTPNAFTSACTASCGGGTQTTWDSCGNVQAVTSCNTQACCTTNYQKTGCAGSTAIYTDEGSCHSASFTQPNGCSLQVVGEGSCSPNVLYPDDPNPNCRPGTSCISTCGRFPGDKCGGWTWSNWGTRSGTCTITETDPGYCSDDPNTGAELAYQCVDWE